MRMTPVCIPAAVNLVALALQPKMGPPVHPDDGSFQAQDCQLPDHAVPCCWYLSFAARTKIITFTQPDALDATEACRRDRGSGS